MGSRSEGEAPTRSARLSGVLRAAATVFRRNTYAGSTVQQIADEFGILKGSLYNYVDGKEDLLFWLLQDFQAGLIANMERVQASDGDPFEKLQLLIDGHVEVIQDSYDRGLGFYDSTRHLSPARAEKLLAQRHRYEEYMRQLISEGKAMGLFAGDADPVIVQIGIITMLNTIFNWYDPAIFRWNRIDDTEVRSLREIGDGFAKMIIHGISS